MAPRHRLERAYLPRSFQNRLSCGLSSGNSFHSRPSNSLPNGRGSTAAYCMKLNFTPAAMHWSLISLAQLGSILRKPVPDSPPTSTNEMPSRFILPTGPIKGSNMMNRLATGTFLRSSILKLYFALSTVTPIHKLLVHFKSGAYSSNRGVLFVNALKVCREHSFNVRKISFRKQKGTSSWKISPILFTKNAPGLFLLLGTSSKSS